MRFSTVTRFAIVLGALASAGPVGMVLLEVHAAARGEDANAPSTLVGANGAFAARLRASGRPSIVLVAHPACPCTRASLRELRRLLDRHPAEADVFVVFVGGRVSDRIASELRTLAGSVPGAQVLDDLPAEETSWLRARTSGTVLFYDRSGALRFSGGITPARGHEGDSAGAAALGDLLTAQGRRVDAGGPAVKTPVFGCGLERGKDDR